MGAIRLTSVLGLVVLTAAVRALSEEFRHGTWVRVRRFGTLANNVPTGRSGQDEEV